MKKLAIFAIVIAAMVAALLPGVVSAAPGELHVGPGQTYSTIQAAVDAASPGDTIIVHQGTYYETVTIRSDDHHLDLVGKGATIANDGTLTFGISLQGGTHHISISGFEITGFSAQDGAGIEGWTNTWDPDFAPMSYITIHHNYIHDNYDGINIGAWVWSPWGPPSWRHNNLTIHHNNIADNTFRGIDWWAVADSTIAHNVISGNAQDGITWVGVQDSTVTHNHINGNNAGYPSLLGVGLSINEGSTGNTVTHNDVTGNVNLGILLTGWNFPTTGNTFVHNDARGNGSWDIREFTTSGGNPAVFGNKWVMNQYNNANPIPLQ